MDDNQLANLENLCLVLYTSTNEAERNHAQQSILTLQSSVDYVPQCRYILDKSTSTYALLVASNSLTKLVSAHWNSFNTSQKLEIRNYALAYLAEKGLYLDNFVVTSLIHLICRVTKLGWVDEKSEHRYITQEVTKFLQATVPHCLIGLQILNELVSEMNNISADRTLTLHRRTCVSFREVSLFQIFQVSLKTLTELKKNTGSASNDQESRMADLSISLAIKCLSFDFIGTNPDESNDDIGAIQVPTSWRSVLQDPETMQLLFDHYKLQPPPVSSKFLECLMLFASIRRSLFSPESERTTFLFNLLSGIREILKSGIGIDDQQNYHEFSRLLGRLKANYQITELIKSEGYREWLELSNNFTIKSFENWEWSAHSVHYLLGLWARLVSAVPYIKTDSQGKNESKLEVYIPNLLRTYICSRLDSVEQVQMNSLDNPLDDEGSLEEQLEKLTPICRFQYKDFSQYVMSLFDPLALQYQEAVNMVDGGLNGAIINGMNSDDAFQQLVIIEQKLAWLVHIIGAVASPQPNDNGDELMDADLSRRVFQLMQLIECRLINSGGSRKCDFHLELAVLYYLNNFRRCYIGEQHGMPSLTISIVDVGVLSNKHKAYHQMFERLGYGPHTNVVNIIVTKIGNNLKFWGEGDVIGKTLNLFLDIASGYSSGKLLLGLDTVQYILGHHNQDEFPFLAVPANTRFRTTFHAILARLLFTTFDDTVDRYDEFMQPILAVLNQLMQTQNYRQENVKQAIIGVSRDLRGIAQSSHNRTTYTALFDYLYPTYFSVFLRAIEEWYDEPAVTTAILKFFTEFVYNKAQRVMFDQSSPNGILLFREVSKVVVAYGKRILSTPVTGNPYANRYKGIHIALSVLSRALGGGYVNFGVFQLYNDKALDDALDIALQLALSISLQDIMAYPKLAKSYYQFMEILFRNHIVALLSLDTTIFFDLIQSLHEGLSSYDLALAAQCASAIDHFATYYYRNQKTDCAAVRSLMAHLSAHPNMMSALLTTLFSIVIYGEASTQWALSRPILSITLSSEQALSTYKAQLAATQSLENQQLLDETFSKLFLDIRPNLTPGNRDKFTQRLGQFRTSLRNFLTA